MKTQAPTKIRKIAPMTITTTIKNVNNDDRNTNYDDKHTDINADYNVKSAPPATKKRP